MTETQEVEALGTDGWEIPDVSEVYDHGKAQRFMCRVLEEAEADGLSLLELMDVGTWVAASCNGRIAANLEELAVAPPPLEPKPVDELPQPNGGGDGCGHDETGEGTGGVDEREESHG